MSLQKSIHRALIEGYKVQFIPKPHTKGTFIVELTKNPLEPTGFKRTIKVEVTQEVFELPETLGLLIDELNLKINENG